ncbi:sugar kinase [Latilactobacillus sakei]|uniref:sugar kinase n=1 Tax=Latilactobacillus sakei TaxID=1599 RepID=UPI0020C79A7E|nr:sugar kinase [Latilactobacillus sakei]MCP8852561.1 sugar kinase [Latilactobacillus sakei]
MKVLTFGEMLMRLKTPGNQRLLQADSFEASYGGAEANVAVSLALLGDQVAYLTKLPENLLGQKGMQTLRGYGVDTTKIQYGDGRLGLYFFEKGASVRSTNVVYDRAHSSFATMTASEFDWATIFEDIDYFYFSGITPAISAELAQAAEAACQYCQAHDIPVVCDLNYRGKLWSPEQAQATIKRLMPYVTICIAHDEDFEATLGIQAFDGDESHGIAQKESFKVAMQQVRQIFPNCQMVASILRNIRSVEDSEWLALLLKDDQFFETGTYQMHVMEGVAAGDAFGAGLMHGLLNNFTPDKMLQFGLAASVAKLTIAGDFNLMSEAEIEAIAQSGGGARLSR